MVSHLEHGLHKRERMKTSLRKEIKMKRKLTQLIAVFCMTIAVCACDESDETNTIFGGTYQSMSEPTHLGAGVWVKVDRPTETGLFTFQNGKTLAFEFTVRNQEAWQMGCPTNSGSLALETFDISQDLIVIDDVVFLRPRLTADCFEDNIRLEGDCAQESMCNGIDNTVSILFKSAEM